MEVSGEWSASRPGCFTPREKAPGTYRIGRPDELNTAKISQAIHVEFTTFGVAHSLNAGFNFRDCLPFLHAVYSPKDSTDVAIRAVIFTKITSMVVVVVVMVKLSLCLTKHHAMKAYWGVEL
jgi:hypothetical protein